MPSKSLRARSTRKMRVKKSAVVPHDRSVSVEGRYGDWKMGREERYDGRNVTEDEGEGALRPRARRNRVSM